MAKRYRQNRHPVMRLVVALAMLNVIFPLLILVVWCFVSAWPFPQIIPTAWTLRGIAQLFGPHSDLGQILFSSLLISLIVAFLAVVLATLAAQAFTNYHFPGKRLLDFLVLLPIIVPATAFGMGVHVLFIKIGLTQTVTGVIIVHLMCAIPYSIRIMTDVTGVLGRSLMEQALVLGSSPLKAFFQVAMPPLLPGMVAAASMAFIISYGNYFLTLLLGGGQVKTLATVMVPVIAGGDRTISAAYAVFYVLTAFLVFLLFDLIGRKLTKNRKTYLM